MSSRLTSLCLIFFLVSGGLIGFLNIGNENAQGGFVSGPITVDTTWDLAGSPYIVNGDVTVEIGVTLTIEPGVWVTFDGYYAIYVDGSIIAIGTESDRIIINSFKVFAEPRDWRNIEIKSSGYGEFKYCNVSHSDYGITSYSSNNLITNNNFSNNSRGIDLESSSNNNITHNHFWSNIGYGIYITSSSNNIINKNNFLNNDNAISLLTSSNNIITNNNLSTNGHGLSLRESINDTIIYNNVSNNAVGIHVRDSLNINIIKNNFINDGVYLSGFQLSNYNSHTIPDNNTLNGKPLLYYKDTTDIKIEGIPVGQIILANCRNIVVRNILLIDIEVGIQVAYSSDILITDNHIENNNYQNISATSNVIGGISLFESSNNIISNNTLIHNLNAAIWLDQLSNNNVISNNNISTHEVWSILIASSSNNNVIDNDVWNNRFGITLTSSIQNTVMNNNVWNNDEGILLIFSSLENVISWNTISSNNDYGIFVWSSSTYNSIDNNIISNSDYGMYVDSSPFNVITDNTISNNSNGTYNENSPNTIISNNIISNNGVGLILRKSPGSEISANKISSNNNRGIYVYMSSNSNVTSNDETM
jgi:parallel beta-helix repeat protein